MQGKDQAQSEILAELSSETRSTNPRKPAEDPSVAPGRQPSKI